jgi:DNA repair protein RecO (recombination protein O)
LLPEHAPQPELFDFAYNYFTVLDSSERQAVGNFPLYFIISCGNMLGYELKGDYSPDTPHLNLQEGAFTESPPAAVPFMADSDAIALSGLLKAAGNIEHFIAVEMNAAMRSRLLEWYIAFLQQHSQHMGNIKSLSVLHAILHE